MTRRSDLTPETPFPPVSQQLLERLEGVFRDRLPDEPQSAEAVARLVGQQDVIRKLRFEFERQSQNNTTSTR